MGPVPSPGIRATFFSSWPKKNPIAIRGPMQISSTQASPITTPEPVAAPRVQNAQAKLLQQLLSAQQRETEAVSKQETGKGLIVDIRA